MKDKNMSIACPNTESQLADRANIERDPGSATNRTAVGATWEHEDLAQVQVRVFRGHEDSVKSCQFCDNDSKILTASSDRTVMLWDRDAGEHLNTYEGAHSLNITQARATSDASRIVSCSWDKTICVWDTETADILWTGGHDGLVTCCNFSHDGSLVVSGSDLDHTLKVWDAYTGELIHTVSTLHSSTITSCHFTETDDRVVTTSMDKSTKLWDIRTQRNTISLGKHINIVTDASITTDERQLVTVSYDKSILFWDISTGTYRVDGPGCIEKAHEGCISSCDFSRDGTLLVTGGYDQQVCMWGVDHRVQKLRLQGHTDWVEDVCFSADQKWILSASKDKTARLWNVENSDDIPMVLERRKAIGLKIFNEQPQKKCSVCKKPFSTAEAEDSDDIKYCVFCRLQMQTTQASSITE